MKELYQKSIEAMDKLDSTCEKIQLEQLALRSQMARQKALEASRELHKTCMESRAISKCYYNKPVVRILNPVQAYQYLRNNAVLVDCYADPELMKLVFVFEKAGTKALYEQWLKHEI